MAQFLRTTTQENTNTKPQKKDPILQLAEIFLAINEREHIVNKIAFAETEGER